MTAPNGQAGGSERQVNQAAAPLAHTTAVESKAELIQAIVAELEVPFDPTVSEWRVTNTRRMRNSEVK